MQMQLWEMFNALGEPTRLRVFLTVVKSQQNGKAEGESVGDLCRMVGLTMCNLSHHLGVLRNAGVLESVKHGRHVYYKVGSDFVVGSRAEGVFLISPNEGVEMLLTVTEPKAG